MLIILAVCVSIAVSGIVPPESTQGQVRQIPDKKFERFYNGVFGEDHGDGQKYGQLDEDYFDKLTSEYEDNENHNNFIVDASNEKVDETTSSISDHDPTQVLA